MNKKPPKYTYRSVSADELFTIDAIAYKAEPFQCLERYVFSSGFEALSIELDYYSKNGFICSRWWSQTIKLARALNIFALPVMVTEDQLGFRFVETAPGVFKYYNPLAEARTLLRASRMGLLPQTEPWPMRHEFGNDYIEKYLMSSIQLYIKIFM